MDSVAELYSSAGEHVRTVFQTFMDEVHRSYVERSAEV